MKLKINLIKHIKAIRNDGDGKYETPFREFLFSA